MRRRRNLKKEHIIKMPNEQKGKRLIGVWDEYGLYIMGAVLGAVCFVVVYGVRILNPTYDAWLLQGGDTTAHYVGWEFYRMSDWRFPIGLMDRICYPNSVSIIFTDSIPVFAVLFKLLSPLLPETFQYFGWWALLCFMLQGAFSANLIYLYLQKPGTGKKTTRKLCPRFIDGDKAFALAGSLFFVLTPVLLMKMFMHTALASHWLLTASLYYARKYIGFSEKQIMKLSKGQMARWGILGMLCGSIHIYFIPLCGIILSGFLLVRVIRDKKILPSFLTGMSFCAGAVGTVLALGGLSHDHQWDAGGLGQFSFNMNGFFNSMGWSRWFPLLSSYGEGFGEGFSYLGVGIFILLLIGVLNGSWNFFRNFRNSGNRKKFSMSMDVWGYIFIVLICVLLSASHKFALNGNYVFEIPYPRKIVSLWGIFRASGRFIWPVIYLIMLWAMDAVRKAVKSNKMAIPLLLAALAVQNYDIGRLIEVKRDFVGRDTVVSIIQDDGWEQIAEGKEHIVFVSPISQNHSILFSMCQFALAHGMTVNDGYFSHSAAAGDIEKSREESMAELSEDTLYIFKEQDKDLCGQYELEYFLLDGLTVGVLK